MELRRRLLTQDDGVDLAAQETFVKLTQRLISTLQTPTAEGSCYEIDARLRPSGNQGTLVTSLETFARYHESAQTWERQALLRARPVAGHPELAQAFQALSLADQQKVVAFLDSLGRTEFDSNGDNVLDQIDLAAFVAAQGGGPYTADDPEAVFDIDQNGFVDQIDLDAFVLVYEVDVASGEERLVRDARFTSVTLRGLRDIIAASDTQHVYNLVKRGPFRSSSSFRASIVHPAILLSEMELASTERKPSKLPHLAHPLFDATEAHAAQMLHDFSFTDPSASRR